MYLKAIELQGFKSFPEKTRLSFDEDIVAIVGPNGSGKSNISDAVLWVLGEQKSRMLRGSKMEDVIFGGTEKRAPLGFAQVSLVLDNSSGFLDYDSDEVVLARRYYRSGESEYFINRESVRLKDVNTLLMDTGLGRDGYSNIGQGRIADIISDKNTDRRDIFEEAAGISRYRYRKDEAENQLKKTEDNLLRINDKIEELEIQVEPLKRQAETAKKYLLLRDELRIREVSLWMANLDKIHERSSAIQEEFERASEQLESAKKDMEALFASASSLRERMKQKDLEADREREKLKVLTSGISEHESAAAVYQSEIKSSEEKIRQLEEDIETQEKRAADIQNSILQYQERVRSIEADLTDKNEKLKNNANVLDGCRLKLTAREKQLRDFSQQSDSIRSEILSIESRVSVLSELERDYEGFGKSVREVMNASRRGSLSGIRGPVAELLKTEDEYTVAIETALGSSLQFIVTESQKDAKNAIEMLKRSDKGRATFLPLDITEGSLFKLKDYQDNGLIGIAYDLVSFDAEYDGIFRDRLGRILIAETLSDAIRISNQYDRKVEVVSLDGQVVHARGSLTGGSFSKSTGFLSRKNELEKLKKSLHQAKDKAEEFRKKITRVQEEADAVRYTYEGMLEERENITSQISSLQAEKSTVLGSISQMESFYRNMTSDREARKKLIHSIKEEIDLLEQKVKSEKDKVVSLSGLVDESNLKIREILEKKMEMEETEANASAHSQEQSGKIIELERILARTEQKKISSEMEEKQIIDRLWDNYELNHSQAAALRQPIESMQRYAREITSLKNEISALGTPNIGAIEEYARVSDRYEFLSSQRDDVNKAKNELNGIISELTEQMKVIFLEKFRAIDEEFRYIFRDLFGGGKAALVLDDENNVLECGISIQVQPPGKALSTISLLSGGEMSFVAIALYFAILNVRPTPFCIMDEIDAALDDSNIDRFADYLVRMSGKTQFLVITHRRGTMEAAQALYGVTMQEKGVSMVIPMNIDEAKNLAEG